jgi:hypothetical protein
MLFKKISLDAGVVADIKACALEEMTQLDLTSAQIHFLTKPQYILGRYLNKQYPQLPRLHNCLLFHRPGNFPQALHIDCNNDDPPRQMLAAINIPLLNCEDSYMEWYGGQYKTVVNAATGPDGKVRKFLDLQWLSAPELLDKTIIDQPTLVRVNVPHRVSVISRTRSLITFRFAENPAFDAVADIVAGTA